MGIVGIVGLGYVGLPLAIELGKKHQAIGYDQSLEKIASYKSGIDPMGEVSAQSFRDAKYLIFKGDAIALKEADSIIVAVPTPVDVAHNPDFSPLVSASETVGKNLKRGAVVIYESTVYPGATEEVCVPILERFSGLKWKRDFHVGYSPERINPGDKEHTLTGIVKVVSGDDEETLDRVATLYGSIVNAGVYRAPSIRVAEAAKVIENTQRDLNIALVNELAIIFHRIGIDTQEVLAAAGTKWNFLPFRPGLVGGHCIGVDPYYLTYKAETLGYHPEVILAGRRINDGMGKYVAEQTVKQLANAGFGIKDAQVNVIGLTFKEDCPDLRNSKVVDVINELKSYGIRVSVHDPVCSVVEAQREYGIAVCDWQALPRAHANILAVTHRALVERPAADWIAKTADRGCIIDVKAALPIDSLRGAGLQVWRL